MRKGTTDVKQLNGILCFQASSTLEKKLEKISPALLKAYKSAFAHSHPETIASESLIVEVALDGKFTAPFLQAVKDSAYFFNMPIKLVEEAPTPALEGLARSVFGQSTLDVALCYVNGKEIARRNSTERKKDSTDEKQSKA